MATVLPSLEKLMVWMRETRVSALVGLSGGMSVLGGSIDRMKFDWDHLARDSHMQRVHKDKIKAEHGYQSGHLRVRDAEDGAKQMLRWFDRFVRMVISYSEGSIEV